MRRRTIRSRLVRILALPLAAVVVLLAVVVIEDTNAYQAANQTDKSVKLLLEAGNLVHFLQQERGVVAGLLGGDVSFKVEMQGVRQEVDNEIFALNKLAVGSDATTVRTALTDLGGLDAFRTKVDAKKVSFTDAFTWYTARISELTGIDVGAERSPDETLRRGVEALQALDAIKEYTAQERAFLNAVFSTGGFANTQYQTFAYIDAELQAAMATFRQDADPGQLELITVALNTGAAQEAEFFKARALAAVNDSFVVNPQSWWSANTTMLDDMRAAQVAVGSDIAQRAKDLQDSARLRLSGLGVLGLLSIIGVSLLLVSASRSITRPLAILAFDARAIADIRLPEAVARARNVAPEAAPQPPPRVAIPRRSSAEVAAVAEALDSAQTTAYELATTQARLLRSTSESLANLGRRNQNLLRRQLGFITQLEREETDPSGLANLFELDHLATRMRRNAESLLVLVGESRPRTWSEPVPVADVLRAAISEVEDYRRVTLRRLDDGYVGGAFVAGVAHVIAELVENGLAFSPPDADVEIQGRLMHGRYLVGITDQGIGMERADLERANARLRGEESFLTAPTRFLGHYVVGQLARQMGVEVELSPSPITGVTARVILTAPVLSAPPSTGPIGPTLAIAGGRSRPDPDLRADGRDDMRSEIRPDMREDFDDLHDDIHDDVLPAEPVIPVSWFDGSMTATARGQARVVPPGDGPVAGRPVAAATAQAFAVDVAHGRGERTRNGLLKRVPGPRTPVRSEAAEPVQMEPTPGSSTQVRDTLNSLRAAMARGAEDYATTQNPQSPSLREPETERSTHVR